MVATDTMNRSVRLAAATDSFSNLSVDILFFSATAAWIIMIIRIKKKSIYKFDWKRWCWWFLVICQMQKEKKKGGGVSSVLTIRWRSVTNGAEQMKPLQQKIFWRVKKLLQKILNARENKPRPSHLFVDFAPAEISSQHHRRTAVQQRGQSQQ